jgi:beta-glucuronidase
VKNISLNGLWSFAYVGEANLDQLDPLEIPLEEKIPVPAAFDALPDYAGKRGTAIYETTFEVPIGLRGRLEFGAVSMWCRIYVDGQMLEEHASGYTPFPVDVPPAAHSIRVLRIVVDNRFDFGRAPMHEPHFDFYQYGGILRDVRLRLLPATGPFIDSLQISPTASYREGEANLAVVLQGSSATAISLALHLDGKEACVCRDIPVVEGIASVLFRVPSPRVWSIDQPNLHEVAVQIVSEEGSVQDQLEARFGLRRIEMHHASLWLNGEKLILKGYNRHEWHPNFGPCTPFIQMAADLQLLRQTGSNFIRGSHYPQDQRFLDLCDELGVLVWEENLGWGQGEQTCTDGKFQRDHAASLRNMLRASFNHPSIIMWGFLNEAHTDCDAVRPIFEESVSYLRAADPTRLVSFASNRIDKDKCFDLVDVISLNLYPGWYGCEEEENPLSLWDPQLNAWIEEIDRLGHGEKPILVSETGAEALYGWHDPHNDFYTEEFQAEYIRTAINCSLSHPRCCGVVLWHFSDIRTPGGGRSMKRPRAFNNKGTFDEYRRPKLAFKVVAETFAQWSTTNGRDRPRRNLSS